MHSLAQSLCQCKRECIKETLRYVWALIFEYEFETISDPKKFTVLTAWFLFLSSFTFLLKVELAISHKEMNTCTPGAVANLESHQNLACTLNSLIVHRTIAAITIRKKCRLLLPYWKRFRETSSYWTKFYLIKSNSSNGIKFRAHFCKLSIYESCESQQSY